MGLVEAASDAYPDLRDGEKEAVSAFAEAREAHVGDELPGDATPATRAVRATVVRWLLTNADQARGSASGFRLRGARIDGELDLAGFRLAFPLVFHKCRLGRVDVRDADLATLDLTASHCTRIQGDRMHVKHGMLIGDGFSSKDLVFLPDASIGGDLNCDRGSFMRGEDRAWAVLLDGARIGGRLFMRRAHVSGPVSAQSARFEGGFLATETNFCSPGEAALTLDGTRIGGRLRLMEATFEGGLAVRNASVGFAISLPGAQFSKTPGTVAVDFDGTSVGGGVIVSGATLPASLHFSGGSAGGNFEVDQATIDGTVRLSGSPIGGSVVTNAETVITAGDEPAVELNGVRVGGNLELHGRFEGRPALNLTTCAVEGDADLRGGRFVTGAVPPPEYERTVAIRGEGLAVRGSWLAKNLVANGEIRLPRSNIGGELDFSAAHLERRVVLGANEVGGRLLFEGTRFAETKLDGPKENGLSMVSGRVRDRLAWSPTAVSPGTELDLSHASVGYLDDAGREWTESKVVLDGFTYPAIENLAASDDWIGRRLRWIRKYAKTPFSPQPYEQLIAVLRQSGHEPEARKVAMAKQDDLRPTLPWAAKWWNYVMKVSLGHGHQIWRPLAFAVAVVVLGAVLFRIAHNSGDFERAKAGDAPAFHAVAYSFDALVPVINLHQEEYQLPTENWSWYLWVHIVVGWLLTTLIAIGVTGLVRRE